MLVKHGKNRENKAAEQKANEKAIEKANEKANEKAEEKKNSLDQNTTDLLKDLKAVLEISDTEKPEKAVNTVKTAFQTTEKSKSIAAALATEAQKAVKTEPIGAKPAGEAKKADDTAEQFTKPEPRKEVSYASMAQAVEEAKKEPTGRFSRDAVDDETLLAELHALIGDPAPAKPTQSRAASPAAAPRKPSVTPEPRPVVRITPDALKNLPEDDDEEVMEADTMGVPGWVKGVFILLISLLLGAMTFYAVASDVLGKVF